MSASLGPQAGNAGPGVCGALPPPPPPPPVVGVLRWHVSVRSGRQIEVMLSPGTGDGGPQRLAFPTPASLPCVSPEPRKRRVRGRVREPGCAVGGRRPGRAWVWVTCAVLLCAPWVQGPCCPQDKLALLSGAELPRSRRSGSIRGGTWGCGAPVRLACGHASQRTWGLPCAVSRGAVGRGCQGSARKVGRRCGQQGQQRDCPSQNPCPRARCYASPGTLGGPALAGHLLTFLQGQWPSSGPGRV